MKKFILALIFCICAAPCIFADSDTDSTADSDFIAGVPGLRLSLLGLEPTLAVDIFNFELEGGLAMSSGLKGEQFGIAPSVSVGYNTNPFKKGAFTVFGLEYMYLSPAYTQAYFKSFASDDSDLTEIGVHAVSLFYKGGVSFNKVVGLLWRVRLPLVIAGSADGESFNLNVTNWAGFGSSFLIGICTFAIGVKFTI